MKYCHRFASAVLVLVAAVTIARAQEVDQEKAAVLKAAYLRSIAAYTVWPDDRFSGAGDPIVIGFLGEDPNGIADSLEEAIRTRGLTAQDRPLELRRLTYAKSPTAGDPQETEAHQNFSSSLRDCHMLFLTRSEEQRWADVRPLLGDAAVITVSELDGFAVKQGMIECVVASRQGKSQRLGIDLHINLTNVKRVGLRISSRLLGLKQGIKIVE